MNFIETITTYKTPDPFTLTMAVEGASKFLSFEELVKQADDKFRQEF